MTIPQSLMDNSLALTPSPTGFCTFSQLLTHHLQAKGIVYSSLFVLAPPFTIGLIVTT